MGQNDTQQILAPLGDELGIGRHDIDAGQALVGEGDAEVDHQPLAAEAVEIEVHADLAGPAQRQEDQLVGVEILRRSTHSPLFRR